MAIIQVEGCQCGICGHIWLPTGGKHPARCAKCKSFSWDIKSNEQLGWVYFAQSISNLGPIKIGYSSNPHSRVKSMVAPDGNNVQIIAKRRAYNIYAEKMLHDYFSKYRVKVDNRLDGHTEWFDITVKEIDLLPDICSHDMSTYTVFGKMICNCAICSHVWVAESENIPMQCAKCRSRHWGERINGIEVSQVEGQKEESVEDVRYERDEYSQW